MCVEVFFISSISERFPVSSDQMGIRPNELQEHYHPTIGQMESSLDRLSNPIQVSL